MSKEMKTLTIGGNTYEIVDEKARESIPTKTSELENNSGFITADDLPESSGNVDLSDYYTKTEIDDKGFITADDLLGDESVNLSNYYTKDESDAKYATKADIPTDENYELIGQTPLTLENGGNIKLVADGEASYSMVAPTVWNFDDAELTLNNVELTTDEGYYKFIVNKEGSYGFQHNVTFVISGLEIGKKYKFVFDITNRPDDAASRIWNGYIQPYAGTQIAGTPLFTHYLKDGTVEFTATDTSVAVRYIVVVNKNTPYVGWVAAFNKMYLNYADMSDELTEIYSNSGTFTDVETFKSIPFGVYITTDPTANIYRKAPTDKTLTQSDVPADAAATGKEITEIKSYLPMFGKTIVNFGDSIFGKVQSPNDISTLLAKKTGATVYNCGFGGCKMAETGADNDPFSMCSLSEAIANNDYTAQDNAITDTAITLPDYFATSIERLKSIDFSSVDIVTIAYGTNDFMGNIDTENAENAYDKATLCGALRYSIETLLSAYPNLRIFVLSTTYRFWVDTANGNAFLYDSNTYTNADGIKLADYNTKLKEIADEYNIPFVDDYNIGINKFNRSQYFSTTDGTHHQIEGRKLIAEHLAGALANAQNSSTGEGLTDEQSADLAANTEARHTHDNKDTLDLFGINTAKTRPTFNDGLTDNVLATQYDVTSRINDLKTYTIPNLINDAISEQTHWRFEIVEALLETGEPNVIYLVPNSSEGSNVYDEYIFVNEAYEIIGSTQIDLTKYAKTEDIPTKTSELENDSGFISETEVDEKTATLKTEIVDGAPEQVNTLGKMITVVEAGMDTLDERITSLESGSDDIPTYWQTALDEGVEAINTAIETAGINKSSFLFYTDAHWGHGSAMSPKLLKYLCENTAINKVNFGGDFCNTYNVAESEYMSKMREWRKAVRNLSNHHSVIGNHDDDITELTSEAQRYGFLLAPEETNDVVRGDYFHYYIDNQPEKTRYIYLDTGLLGVSPYKVSDKSAQFTIDALNSTPEGWHIVVISHIWFEYESTNTPTVGTIPAYCQGLLDMFDAYNVRSSGSITPNNTAISYDFTNANGKVEFCIGGHIHVDYVVTSTNKIPVVMCQTDSYHCRGDYTATTGTTTEASVSGIVADYESDKLTVVRVGRGNSFEVMLSTGEVTEIENGDDEGDTPTTSYTNVLDAVGYTKGIYLSNGVETTDANAYTTGFIPVPVSANTMIYLKNITMPDESSHGNRIACYDADKNFISGTCYSLTSSVSDRNAAWDENNNLTQFKIGYTNVSYVRISAWLIDETSIITINEPIE